MEGPSLYLAAERLSPFIGKTILKVEGNTHIGKERLFHQNVLDIFSWGKHLIMQFETFALRTHFMLYGSYRAYIKGEQVSGDYPRKAAAPRLELTFKNGQLIFYSCSLRFLETSDAKGQYDYSVDIMSHSWDSVKVLKTLKEHPEEEIGDLLLDQTMFAGVGNIIKNEVLFLARTAPSTLVADIPVSVLKQIAQIAPTYGRQFYEWRKLFELRKHYQIYRQSFCPLCNGKVTRKWTGKRERVSFFCSNCQK